MQKKTMSIFLEERKGIYRLKVPFENIYTSVFLIKTKTGIVLVDCASSEDDVNRYIFPAIREMGYLPSDIEALILTHRHSDHAGGLARFLELVPNLNIITEEGEVCDGIFTYPLPGHTEDFIGVLVSDCRTLISGDGLQGAGVDKYRTSVKLPHRYLETLDKVTADERVENLLFSHAYEPWNCDVAIGREAVLSCVEACKKYVKEF
jgi:glyoxylase-like metal-dependent hydrolase (beta-lactamase superfamily II)